MSINKFVTTYSAAMRNLDQGEFYRPILPRNAFTYFIEIQFNEEALETLQNIPLSINLRSLQNNNAVYIKSFSKPGYTFETENLNSYNTNYHLKKKITYSPVSASMYDDTNSMVRNFLEVYRSYYVQTGELRPSDIYNSDLIDKTNYKWVQNPQVDGTQLSLGMKTRSTETADLIDYVTIYDLGNNPKTVQAYVLYNPKITSVENVTLDYTDGTGFQEILVNFDYTYYTYHGRISSVRLHNDKRFFASHLGKSENNGIEELPLTDDFGRDNEFFEDLMESERQLRESIANQLIDPVTGEVRDDSGILGDLQRAGVNPGRIVQAIQRSIQGGRLNIDDLRQNLFIAVAQGTPIQNIRNVARNIRLVQQALRQGRFTDLIPLIGQANVQIQDIDIRSLMNANPEENFAMNYAQNLIGKEVSNAQTWLSRHLNPRR